MTVHFGEEDASWDFGDHSTRPLPTSVLHSTLNAFRVPDAIVLQAALKCGNCKL